MNNLNKFSKITLFVSVLSGVLWMGSYLCRLFLTFKLFEEEGIQFKNYVTEENLSGIFITVNAAVTSTVIVYLLFIIFFILFLISSKISLRNNGWLFIITVIVFITLPFEAYLMSFDYEFIKMIGRDNFSLPEATSIFKKRYEVLGSFPLVELFSYFSIIYFMIFQPLTKKQI